MSEKKLKIIFLCSGNLSRCQMAEGWARKLKRLQIEPYSVSLENNGPDLLAEKVMAEVGIDISKQRPVSLQELKQMEFDFVITLCRRVARQSIMFPLAATKTINADFPDPAAAAEKFDNEAEKLNGYRQVRDRIRKFIETIPEYLFSI